MNANNTPPSKEGLSFTPEYSQELPARLEVITEAAYLALRTPGEE